jgi:hypothetical protein
MRVFGQTIDINAEDFAVVCQSEPMGNQYGSRSHLIAHLQFTHLAAGDCGYSNLLPVEYKLFGQQFGFGLI